MRGDFSRLTWHLDGGAQAVMLQQGRVLLDSDFNAQSELSARGLRQLTRDLLGPHAGPPDALGFGVTENDGDFEIAFGRYYVAGWLAVNAPDPQADPTQPLLYDAQAGFPFPGAQESFEKGRPYFFFLDVWDRCVTALEDPTIRETALGGPDTAVRRERVWQVRAITRPGTKASDFDTGEKALAWLDANVQRHPAAELSAAAEPRLPQMVASVDPKDNPDDTPCVADPLGGYTGLENQLYRVEIHAVPEAGGNPTFKWSRDNGSVVGALVGLEDDDLIVAGIHDTAHGFSAGQWVEVVDRTAELRGVPGVLVRLVRVDRDRLTYDPASASGTIPAMQDLRYPLVRRWDHRTRQGQTLDGGAIVLEEDTDYALERGIHVRFPAQPAGATGARVYAVGDYWTFPARAATGDIEWPYTVASFGGGDPVKTYLARDPDGIEHAYAPLAVATLGGAATTFQRTINQLWTDL